MPTPPRRTIPIRVRPRLFYPTHGYEEVDALMRAYALQQDYDRIVKDREAGLAAPPLWTVRIHDEVVGWMEAAAMEAAAN